MRILISNDDGYFSPGISLLAERLATLGSVTVPLVQDSTTMGPGRLF